MALRITFFSTMDLYLYNNHLSFEKKLGPTPITSGSYSSWQADKIRLDYAIVKILYRLNYLDFYFVDIIAILLSVRSGFQFAFLKQSIF